MAEEEQILLATEEIQILNDLDVSQQHANDPPTRSTRRSSILKTTVYHNEPVGRRISKRISFHNNIFCQQILADGTTQVVTENLKAKLPLTSASTVSDSDGKSTIRFQQTADSENIDPSISVEEKDTKRKSTDQVDHEANQPLLPKRVKKDPKLIAKSYQKFMTKTYDFQDENDYHTIFNTSVNRNGYEVAPRDARPDVTKLFSAETSESNMDVTKILSNPSSSPAAASIPTPLPLQEDEITRIFNESTAAMSLVDFSRNSQKSEDVTRELASIEKEEGTSAGNAGDISEMDTAMIIDEDLECTENEVFQVQQRSALIPSRFITEASIDDISMSITGNVPPRVSISIVENVAGHEKTEMQSAAMTLVHFEKTESLELSQASRTEPQIDDQVVTNPEQTKRFDPQSDQAKMVLETEENEVSLNKTNIFCESNTGNGMSIEDDLMDPSPLNSQEVTAGSQPMDKETSAFGTKSSTFQRRQTLSKMMARFSFPKILDNVLEMRKRQLNQDYLDPLTSLELSESIESILSSPSIHSSSIASPTVQRSTVQYFHTSPSRLSLSTSNCSTPEKSPGRLFSPRSQLIKSLSAKRFDSSKQTIIPEVQQVPEPEPEQMEEFETIVEETWKSKEKCPTEPTLSDSSSSTILEMEIGGINFDKSYNIPAGLEEEDEPDLCEDSMFEIMNRIHESSFALSPESSFQSSFICMDDTLAIQIGDLDCKVNSFQFSDDGESSDKTSQFQGVFVPLRKFEANKFDVRFDLSSENEPTIYFLYDLIEVHITFGVTARSFNGVPIKFIQKLLVKSAFTKDNQFIPNQSSSPFLINFSQNHQCLFECTSDLVVACFEDNKRQLLKKHPTSDLLPELLREVAQWIMRGRDLLHEITTIANFTNFHFYQKLDNMYEFAFELPGPRRNFFLIVPFDPKTYPFQPIQPRFGFYPEDRTLVSVNNFSKALSMCIKPGKDYLQRLVDNAKKFVIFFRKIEQKRKRTQTEKNV